MLGSLKSKTVKILIFNCFFSQIHGEQNFERQGVENRIAVDGKEVFDHSLTLGADYDKIVKGSVNPEAQNALKNAISAVKQGVDAKKTVIKKMVEKCLAESNFRNILELKFSVLAGGSLLGRMVVTVDLTGLNKAAPITPYVMDLIRKTIIDSANADFESWEGVLVECLREEERPATASFYSCRVSWNVEFQSKDIISLREYNDNYYGGNGSHCDTKCYTFWMIDGQPKPIKLEDLFKKGSDWASVLNPFVGNALFEEKKRRGVTWLSLTDITLEFEWNRFAKQVSILPKGITIYFNPYDVGSGGEGEYTVHVPFSVLETVLRSDGVMRALRDS